MSTLHCVDTSSFIDLHNYPRDLFGSLWEFLEKMVSTGRLIAPREVLRELEKGDDDIYKWAKTQNSAFVDLSPELGSILAEIVAAIPGLTAHMSLRTGPYADPILVALALFNIRNGKTDCVVVTQERATSTASLKIPNICARYRIKSMSLLDMVRGEGLKFELRPI